jgi:vitamin B12 transporter
MKPLRLAGLAGLSCLAAQAQVPPRDSPQSLDALVVTATRSLQPGAATLRDTTVITREDLEAADGLSLAEVLLRRAGVEYRATGGPGQPTGLFMRGAGTAQTLVLIDGLRAGSATVGTTSIENIPLELIERIEVVKGPMSSLYGSDAIGGVVQIFTRGRKVPHLFGSASYGEDNDARLSVGLASVVPDTQVAFSAGVRKVDAASATNDRNSFSHNPDRDPHENAFANFSFSQRFWQGETIGISAFATRGKTHFDAGSASDDVNDQSILGVRLFSASQFMPWWASRLSLGHGRDELETSGSFPGRFETRQDQASWINEFNTGAGTLVAGLETLRQEVLGSTPFSTDQRDTNSAFVAINEYRARTRFEASLRRDDDDQFGARNTGSASYGVDWPGLGVLSGTYGEGFRAPSFFDLYGPASDFYVPNPDLRPERSKSTEISLESFPAGTWQWRLTAFDNRLEDLITYVFPTVENVRRARIKGVEATAETTWLGARWRSSLTSQRPRDDDTGLRLQGRAELFGSLDASRRWGPWTAGFTVVASGDRFDSTTESSASRLPGYATLDARVRYRIDKNWAAELGATNLLDKRYESAVGYDAPRRSVFLKVTFDAF